MGDCQLFVSKKLLDQCPDNCRELAVAPGYLNVVIEIVRVSGEADGTTAESLEARPCSPNVLEEKVAEPVLRTHFRGRGQLLPANISYRIHRILKRLERNLLP